MKRLALLVGIAMGLGCAKTPTSPAGGGTIGNTPAGPVERALLGEDDLLAMMPVETDWVVHADADLLRTSALGRRFEPRLRARFEEILTKLAELCGVDLLTSITSGYVSGQSGGQDVVVIARGPDRAVIGGCLTKLADATKGVRIVIDGDFVELDDGDRTGFLFVDDRTTIGVMRGGVSASRAELAAVGAARAGDGLTSSPAFRKLLDRVDRDAALWMLVNGRFETLRNLPVKLDAIYADVRVGDGIDGRLVFAMRGASEADALADMLRPQLDQLRTTPYAGLVAQVEIAVEADEVAIRFRLDAAQIDQIVALVAPLFP